MKPLQKFLYHASAYTVAISMLFFFFASALRVPSLTLTFNKYFVIFIFGLICSAAEFLFSIDRLPKVARYTIHYIALAAAYFVIFLTVRGADGNYEFNAASVFAAIIIFTCFYVLIMTAVSLAKRKASRGSKLEKSSKERKPDEKKYTSRFS